MMKEVSLSDYPEIRKDLYLALKERNLHIEKDFNDDTMYYNDCGYTRFRYGPTFSWWGNPEKKERVINAFIEVSKKHENFNFEILEFIEAEMDDDRWWEASVSFKLLKNERKVKLNIVKEKIKQKKLLLNSNL